MLFSHLSQILYELEKKSSLVTRALSAKSCTRDTDSLHSCTRLRLVQEMACLYHSCKILPRKHSYSNLIPILTRAFADDRDCQLHQLRCPGDVVWDAVRDGDDEPPRPPQPVCLHSLLDDVVPYRW